MLFNEWIVGYDKKLLIVDSNDNFNKLLKGYCKSEKKAIVNTRGVTLRTIARNIACSIYDTGVVVVNDYISSVIVDRLLKMSKPNYKGNVYGFIPFTSVELKTPAEVFKAMNQIRFGKVIKENDKYHNLMKLNDDYTKYMQDHYFIDECELYRLAINFIESNDSRTTRKLIGFGNKLSIGILPQVKKKLTYLEQTLLDKLAGIYDTKLEYISLDEKSDIKESFVSCYGGFNEVSYVLSKIGAGIKTGDTHVLYTSDEYENMVRSVFENAGIKATFSDAHANSTNIIQMLNDLIDFYKDDMLYEKLYNIVKNPVIKLKDANRLYTKALKAGICVGKGRYLDFIENNRNDENSEFLDFLSALAEVDYENGSADDIYQCLLKIINKYTYKNQEYISLIEKLTDLKVAFIIMSDLNKDLLNPLDYIKDTINNISYSEPSEDDKVLVEKLSGFTVLERDNVFVLGMSSSNLKKKEVESAIFSDYEYEEMLDSSYYLDVAKLINSSFEDCLDNTFLSMQSGNLYFTYSSFDTVEFNPLSPSVYFLNRLGTRKCETFSYKYDENEYIINKKDVLNKVKSYSKNKEEEADNINNIALSYTSNRVKDLEIEIEAVAKEREIEIKEDVWALSATGLGSLVTCPMCYIYRYVDRLPSMDFKELNSYTWLDALARGNLFHHTLEDYSNNVYIKHNTTQIEFDNIAFKKAYEKAIINASHEISCPTIKVKEKEVDMYGDLIFKYILSLQKFYDEQRLSGIDYKNIYNELPFGPNEDVKVNYAITSPITIGDIEYPVIVTLALNGSIDRLDGYVDNSGILHFRIIDYKTSKRDHLKKEIEECSKIQHFIYAIAAREYYKVNLAKLEEMFKTKLNGCTLDDMEYALVMSGEHLLWSEGFGGKSYYDYNDLNNIVMPQKVIEAISYAHLYKNGVNLDRVYKGISEYFTRYNVTNPNQYSRFAHICRYEIDTYNDMEDGDAGENDRN